MGAPAPSLPASTHVTGPSSAALTDTLAAALATGGNTALAETIKALAAALSARESVGTGGASAAGLPDTGIDDDAIGVSNPKGHDAMKVFGPYPYKRRWRILIRQAGTQEARSYETEAEAKANLRRLRIEAHRQAGIPCERAIDLYAEQLRTNGLREKSIDTTTYRLRQFFAPVLASPLTTITPARAKELFTRLGGAVDTRRNTLAEAKTFVRKAKANGWTGAVLLADVRGEGRRRYGKTKLSLDESRKYLAACLDLARSNNLKKRTAGIGAAMPLIFGMRASEITGLQVRDLDAGGTIICIRRAKTHAGVRSLQVPEWFRPFLATQAAGKAPTDPLIGRERTWLHRNVTAICRRAEVTEAPPHGLRGTHGDLALTAAVAPKAVSEALGHESLTTTFRHYTDAGIAQAIEHGRVVDSLAPASAIPKSE